MIGVYIRVSTTDQTHASQKREIERWLAGHNLTEVRWFADKRTGDNLARPAFAALQAAIFAGEIDTVVVYRLDRLSRSLRDGINVLCDWLDKGLRVVAVTQQLDFSRSQGKLIAALLLGLAEMEQETRRERQAAGIAAVLADPKQRAQKYRGRQAGSTSADPARAQQLRAKGLTVAEIAAALEVSQRTAARYLA